MRGQGLGAISQCGLPSPSSAPAPPWVDPHGQKGLLSPSIRGDRGAALDPFRLAVKGTDPEAGRWVSDPGLSFPGCPRPMPCSSHLRNGGDGTADLIRQPQGQCLHRLSTAAGAGLTSTTWPQPTSTRGAVARAMPHMDWVALGHVTCPSSNHIWRVWEGSQLSNISATSRRLRGPGRGPCEQSLGPGRGISPVTPPAARTH